MSRVCQVQPLLCLMFVLSSVCYAFVLLCLAFAMTMVCYVWRLFCPEFGLSSIFHAFVLLCPGFVLSSVCHVYSLSCLALVTSRVWNVLCLFVQNLSWVGYGFTSQSHNKNQFYKYWYRYLKSLLTGNLWASTLLDKAVYTRPPPLHNFIKIPISF